MKGTLSITALFVGLLGAPRGTQAAPIQLTQPEFTAATSGLTMLSEDFEGFAAGFAADPLVFSNGALTVEGPPQAAVVQLPGFCGGGGDKCVFSNTDFSATRTISGFPAGTAFWAVTDFTMATLPDIFRITVTGNSGVSVFDLAGAPFFGFADPAGLISVSFLNLGSPSGKGNYEFDDIVTAVRRPVPEPGSLVALALGIAGLAVRRKTPRPQS